MSTRCSSRTLEPRDPIVSSSLLRVAVDLPDCFWDVVTCWDAATCWDTFAVRTPAPRWAWSVGVAAAAIPGTDIVTAPAARAPSVRRPGDRLECSVERCAPRGERDCSSACSMISLDTVSPDDLCRDNAVLSSGDAVRHRPGWGDPGGAISGSSTCWLPNCYKDASETSRTTAVRNPRSDSTHAISKLNARRVSLRDRTVRGSGASLSRRSPTAVRPGR